MILCAGAYQSPQLLMLSGIGPADDLTALGIDVRLDQPAVGGNLQDHLNAGIILFTDDPTTLETAETEENVALLQTQGRGPLTSNIAEAGGFWRSRDGLDAPDVQFHFAPVMFAEEGLLDPFDHAYSYGVCVVKPTSRGSVSLRSADPADKPRIVHNYLTTEDDWAATIAGIRRCLEIREQSPLKGYERAPYEVPDGDSDEAIRAPRAREEPRHLPPDRDVRDGLGGRRRAARPGRRRPARGRRLGDAERDARQHQRADDHDRREGRRPRARHGRGAGGDRDRLAPQRSLAGRPR